MEEEEEVGLRSTSYLCCAAISLTLAGNDFMYTFLMHHFVQVRAWASACQYQAVLECHSKASAREGWKLKVPRPSP